MEPFQSTRPARGATTAGADGAARRAVSIHAPRAGRDEYADTLNKVAAWFQSTRPARGATPVLCGKHYGSNVSIHAPRAGRDVNRTLLELRHEFQSTRPARGATVWKSR